METASSVMLQQEIGSAVVRARRRHRLTQQALARRLGTRQANICRIEKGMQNLSLDLLARLDRILKLGLQLKVR